MLDRFRLDGKTAIVTGASSGLGVALARGFAEAGADIAIGARRADRLDKTRRLVEETGRRCHVRVTDVSDPDDCRALVASTVAELGGVDILINNAGLGSAVPALKETPEEFRRVVDVNLMGTYWMAQECARVMKPGSSIVNIGSVLGETTAGLPQAAYSASKAAVVGLTRDLAQQWTGRRGIRVNCLEPGFFESEMTAQYTPGYLEGEVARRVLAGRTGDPFELVAAAVFLAGDAASYVTGVALPVDGGILVT
ncbi:NAD(P)-dependent dehydrogenase, short-chain alcohol dehydrogenase family [Sinosporangium album]|uniref:NAD(P)-dependent dehydrogenase, short-chain alcohol dehydrogenase family n=1 Tax=Sinosporangium album TaxID=504805 RepID=A0A1G7S213_9ACTN|nr:SDR family oxidoreductase [Sinosporangium album]SDG17053.1 NAD(P)-dependent dehydrogenase, short-chain alcohol dehydrogenase family [Sinosporangium album]